MLVPFQGVVCTHPFTRGAAPGWEQDALSARGLQESLLNGRVSAIRAYYGYLGVQRALKAQIGHFAFPSPPRRGGRVGLSLLKGCRSEIGTYYGLLCLFIC